jgi:hypothetical protein
VASIFAVTFVIKQRVSLRHPLFIEKTATFCKAKNFYLLEKQTIARHKTLIFIK